MKRFYITFILLAVAWLVPASLSAQIRGVITDSPDFVTQKTQIS